jgi:hypothetical protein
VNAGVVVPEVDGARSTSALGRTVVAAALRPVDPVGARGAESETSWRRAYLVHFRRLLEAGLDSRDAALAIADAGLASLHGQMKYETGKGEVSVGEAPNLDESGDPLDTQTVTGAGVPQRDLVVPYRGKRLTGDDLHRQLDRWIAGGIVEPTFAEAVRTVMANPDWLDLGDRKVVVLGAGAEMGPLISLLRWGADVVAVDLPQPAIWERVLGTAARYGGRLHVPVGGPVGDDGDLAKRAGADLVHDLPRVAAWLRGLDGPMVLGNYVYADGTMNLLVSMAVDALTTSLLRERPETALAFLATPTDVFAVPAAAVAEADRRYRDRSGLGRLRRPVRFVSAGRLLSRNYPPGADPGINDAQVAQQGPNYSLAKRLQRWRAAVERAAGTTVSLNVAPATRTRSVVRNRILAAAYAGAHRFGIEVFEPATSNTLMAALLVHDLRTGPPAQEHPWQDEAYAAAHGGLWRQPYSPRSALGLAVLLGLGSTRG